MNKDIFKLPNLLTILRMLMSIFIFVIFRTDMLNGHLSALFVLCLYIIIALTDLLDGILARKLNMVTELGKELDPLADKMLVWLMLTSFIYLNYVSVWLVLLIVLRDLYVNNLRKRSKLEGVKFATSFIAKAKTFVQMTFIGLILAVPVVMEMKNVTMDIYTGCQKFLYGSGLDILMIVITIFTVYTGVDYAVKYRKAKQEKSENK